MPSDKGLDYGAHVEKYVDCGASLHLEYQDASLLRFNLFSCLQRAQCFSLAPFAFPRPLLPALLDSLAR